MACKAMSEGIPNSEHAIGMRSNDPPATPEEPAAAKVATKLRRRVVGRSITIPNVWHTANVMTVMVIAAPAVLIVAPKGMLIE